MIPFAYMIQAETSNGRLEHLDVKMRFLGQSRQAIRTWWCWLERGSHMRTFRSHSVHLAYYQIICTVESVASMMQHAAAAFGKSLLHDAFQIRVCTSSSFWNHSDRNVHTLARLWISTL